MALELKIKQATLAVMVFCISSILAFPASAQQPAREIDPNDIRLPDNYRIEAFVSNLSIPTTAVFDGEDLLIAESGYANVALPRVLRIRPNGSVELLASAGLVPPVTGLLAIDDRVYISHRGRISLLEDGSLHDIVTDLPSQGDHHNNQLALSPDGKIYIGQGTITNSAVVGIDNYLFGWLPDFPEEHEIPCQDIQLTGQNFETANPLTEADDRVITGAYKPFGTPGVPGEIIPGNPKCGGSIARFNPDGSDYEVIAWGLRNPFGLAFDQNSQLWATYHGADVRGSRPIFNDRDYLVRVEEGACYGWPDYFDGDPVTLARFFTPEQPKPAFLWQEHPPLSPAFTSFSSHSAVNGIAFSPGSDFGFEGHLFVAMFGTFAPFTTGINLQPAGFRVARVDMDTGEVTTFAANTLPGPAYINQQGGFNRPTDVIFGPDSSLYVVDWGSATLTQDGLELVPATGVIWRIYPAGAQPRRPDGPLAVQPAPRPETERQPLLPNVPETYRALAPSLLLIAGGTVVSLVVIFLVRSVRRP